jgi:hypothetical protein
MISMPLSIGHLRIVHVIGKQEVAIDVSVRIVMAPVDIFQADVAPVEPDNAAKIGKREEHDRVLDSAHDVAKYDHVANVVMVEELISRESWVILD